MPKYIITLLLFSFLTHSAENIKISSLLNQSELSQIKSGEMIIKKKEIKGLVWPEITFYSYIPATALESVAIFYALDHQRNYIPNLIKSEVISEESPTRVIVDYELKLPWPLSNSKYRHGHDLEASKDLSQYKVNWWMIKSSNTEKVEGDATFESFEGGTIMRYRSLVVPKSIFANFVESKMVDDVKSSLMATSKEISRVKKQDRSLLFKYVSFIENALSGKFSYFVKKK
ncbi:hypothetical protein [Bacteriovorax sp. Seq25_V]|uniref:hypothetical protein n=1 Tax=Bacteriovorax sp. Seq25_V TaxID=1201288 RepID=UPI00038A336B|nr:hypothetical protein [Bacteriovorax sp. Seq25_V]EQC46046.1 hypothetical protein M900_1723 [Bacteriovorax sp. Seq25_V]